MSQPMHSRIRLPRAEAAVIRHRIMNEMLALEEERMERMKGSEGEAIMSNGDIRGAMKSAEDESIIRRELNKVDPSAVVFSESWGAKKVCLWDIACRTVSRISFTRFIESNQEGITLRALRLVILRMIFEALIELCVSQLGLCLCYCEDWRRSSAGAACCTTYPRIPRNLGGRKVLMLGKIVRTISPRPYGSFTSSIVSAS